ncbi:putative lactoylglutathione lyase [Pullulanibacillus camelliae]|uniref:Putative lactoylglutathione lyase n=1 Tax=Pullulanibacillus camelliae TaxID=1707096 RepID=A0A8J2VM48_9BACL|nr:VOC family protein [Pullulanibacillus camelliae]GGE31436.1 putative lactoylglutathione lyase [Pullulanibacillus camelliae]
MIKGIGHTAYVVEDMEKALEFYCGVLGFQKLFELHDREDKPWIVYIKINKDNFIELFYGGTTKNKVDMATTGYNHLCLEVDDIHAIADHIKSKGLTLDVEPKQGLDLNYQCWVKDPDGNRIEFMQYHPECPQLTK